MARTSFIEDLFDVSRRLPWWAGVGVAVSFYFSVPFLLTHLIPTTDDPIFGAVFNGGEIFITVVFRYIVPVAFVLGALASLVQNTLSSSLLSSTRGKSVTHEDPFADISWRQFEKLTAAYFRERGYYVFETQEGADGGVDLKMLKGSEVFLVQCKHWKARKVPVQMVRELFGVMVAKGAAGAFVVVSGEFTQDAKRFADGKRITLINGKQILHSRPHSVAEVAINEHPAHTAAPEVLCPACNSAMVMRTAKRGAHAGRQFYGCTQYPICKGVVNLATPIQRRSKWLP